MGKFKRPTQGFIDGAAMKIKAAALDKLMIFPLAGLAIGVIGGHVSNCSDWRRAGARWPFTLGDWCNCGFDYRHQTGGQPVACHLITHHTRQLCALLTIGPFWCTQTGTAAFFGMTAGSFPVQL